MDQEKADKQQAEKTNIEAFEFLKKLGEGAYSSVYKVRRKADNELYALKKVKMKNLSSKQKQNSLNEVRILASINHPNVISYKEAFFQADSLYIVMEYADNGDIFGEIAIKKKKQEAFKEEEIWSIFYQICAGLHELHKLKIIHRDLKSANVFINKKGEAKLGDMNVSKVGDLCMTQTGTPYYASPEVWKDLPYDYKSDIWSLGCVLYEMVMLTPPFKGVDMEDLYQNIVMDAFPPISSTFTQNLKLLIDSLLEKTPAKRPSTNYILENIEQIVPEQFQSSHILRVMIKQYSKKNRSLKLRQNGRINELMKTIQFPNRKKHRKMLDSQLTSFLPSPSYSKSHRTTKQESLKKNNIFDKEKMQKVKGQSLLIPTVNISMDQKADKRKKGQAKQGHKGKYEKENGHATENRKSIIGDKNGKNNEKDHQRLILPMIENKRINHRR